VIGSFLRRLGLGAATPRARVFLHGGDRHGIYTNRDFAQLRQIILDQRLLKASVSRIYWDVAGPVPDHETYVVLFWWQGHYFSTVESKYTGSYGEAAARCNALSRRDDRTDHHYSLAVDVTDAVMRQEPGYV
jgi:hypothetical protein